MISASLFSGAGFGDMGFRAMGFTPSLLCEIDPKRTEFTKINFPEAKILTCDISENVDKISSEIFKLLKEKKEDQLFLLYATPPCQGMSKNGIGSILKAMAENKRPKIDKRNHLYIPVIDIVRNVKPRWVFFENVCRLFNFKDVDKHGEVRTITEIIEAEFRDIGYCGKFEQVQMADYGLPQTRLRSVGIFRLNQENAFKKDETFLPEKIIKDPKRRITIRSIISRNETLVANDNKKRISELNPLHRVPKWRPDLDFWLRNTPEGCSAFENNMCLSCSYINNRNDIYCTACHTLLPKPVIMKNGELKLIKGFVSAYKRMYWDKPSSTITTRSAYACSDHKVHPCEHRVLSIYEIAQLQGIDIESVNWKNNQGKQFPDTLLRELIGESVPPLFTKVIAKRIVEVEIEISKSKSTIFNSEKNLVTE
ncbi:DNA cytosine methyltransferase [Yersinia kristensenii]|uniref:DNA cytosine methyltransferase n=1 Tax=Yersinia kristensenii TaxID=28152 RepID=UPI000C2268AE|nr:DNA cytosine methyltransferase [Yersinia kristensenii]PJG64548.1 DNA cytosine methyltransferase [Yersinia kristensenii]